MPRVKRALLIAAAVAAFLATCFFVARWLNYDGVERAAVTTLLRAQADGDPARMLSILQGCADPACRALVRRNATLQQGQGELKIPLYTSQTAHALTSQTGYARVVWFTPGRLTAVQCVLVRRRGNVLAGMRIDLLRLTAPIGRESSCP